ncbi:MAG: formate dehydrogenase subunit alpha, partial [Deltaproteobacteria bacterium]
MTNSINDFDDADLFLVTGSNTTEQHPLIGSRIINAKQRGAQLVIIDPRDIPLAKFADLHLRQHIGTDVAVLNGMMNIIIAEGLYDKAFVETRTENFDQLKEVVKKYPPEVVEKISGIKPDDLKQAARLYAKADKAMIAYAMGITQHTTGVDNVKSCANLAMLTGHLGRAAVGVNPLRGQSNVQGACDMGGLPNVYSGYQAVTDPAVKKKFEDAWAVKNLDDKAGLTITDMMTAAQKGELKALYVMGENPLMSDPDTSHIEHALSNLDFLVVQDIFLTETAQKADVVLPAASFAEKDGTYTNTERRAQLASRAVAAPGLARPDWQIICEISMLAGYPMNYPSPAAVLKEINALTPSYGGITFERLEKGCGLQWPCPNEDHPGMPFLHKDR